MRKKHNNSELETLALSGDPFYIVFERLLFTRAHDDTHDFAKQVAQRYVTYLDATPAHIPHTVRHHVVEELEAEAQEMLVKRMYGCLPPPVPGNYGKVLTVRQDTSLRCVEYSDDSARANQTALGESTAAPDVQLGSETPLARRTTKT